MGLAVVAVAQAKRQAEQETLGEQAVNVTPTSLVAAVLAEHRVEPERTVQRAELERRRCQCAEREEVEAGALKLREREQLAGKVVQAVGLAVAVAVVVVASQGQGEQEGQAQAVASLLSHTSDG